MLGLGCLVPENKEAIENYWNHDNNTQEPT
jgi:hypothetical protein